jgi:hypothetical protein
MMWMILCDFVDFFGLWFMHVDPGYMLYESNWALNFVDGLKPN